MVLNTVLTIPPCMEDAADCHPGWRGCSRLRAGIGLPAPGHGKIAVAQHHVHPLCRWDYAAGDVQQAVTVNARKSWLIFQCLDVPLHPRDYAGVKPDRQSPAMVRAIYG